jgi:Tol biopolymer transport system component/type II secretory pathway pseudopilin PulG
MRKRSHRRGISLVEICVVLAVVGLMTSIAVVGSRRGTQRGQSGGVAQLVAEEIRAARYRAVSQNRAVGIAFPSASAQPSCQGLYVLEGNARPRVTRNVNYSREYPESQIFIGVWGSLSWNRDDLQLGLGGQAVNVAQWGVPRASDYVLMFAPNGSVKSNGLPHTDGHYRIVVANGLTAAGASAPAGTQPSSLSYHELRAVQGAQTLLISPGGSVRVVDGLPDSSGVDTTRNLATRLAQPPTLPGLSRPSSNSVPVVTRASSEKNDQDTTLSIEATDADGDELFVEWETDPPGLGKFSSASQQRMEWQANAGGPGLFRSTWVWSAPPGLAPGSAPKVTYRVSDGHGVTTASLDLEPEPAWEQRIAFTRKLPDGSEELALANENGTGITVVTPKGDKISHGPYFYPTFSPNGRRIAIGGFRTGSGQDQLYLLNSDGTGFRKLTISGGVYGGFYTIGPSWTRKGNHLTLADRDGNVVLVDVRSGTVRILYNKTGTDDGWEPQASPALVDGSDRVLYWTYESIRTVRLDGSQPRTLKTFSDPEWRYARWSKDGQYIFYNDDDGVYRMNWDGSGTVRLLSTPAYGCSSISVSPDGRFLGMGIGDDIVVCTINGAHPDTLSANTAKKLHTNSVFADYQIAWSPDSSRLVFSEPNATGDDYNVHIVNVLGPVSQKNFPNRNGYSNQSPHWAYLK